MELAWTGGLHPLWGAGAAAVHAIHLPAQPWTEALGEAAFAALRPRLGIDFLVIPAEEPTQRLSAADFMSVLEGLLEVTSGLGVKLALRPAPGAAPGLVARLKAARGEAVGFCWDPAIAGDLECISDRLFSAVADANADFSGLERLGYRWNAALPATEPEAFRDTVAALEKAFPAVLFPAQLPAVAPVAEVTLGPGLRSPGERP